MTTAALHAMLSTMTAARKVDPAADAERFAEDEDGPLYTFDDAPIGEPLSEEERALLEEADLGRDGGRMVPHAEVQAMLDRCSRAMKRFGVAGESSDVTVGEILHWLDTGEPSPAIADLIAAGGVAAAE